MWSFDLWCFQHAPSTLSPRNQLLGPSSRKWTLKKHSYMFPEHAVQWSTTIYTYHHTYIFSEKNWKFFRSSVFYKRNPTIIYTYFGNLENFVFSTSIYTCIYGGRPLYMVWCNFCDGPSWMSSVNLWNKSALTFFVFDGFQ